MEKKPALPTTERFSVEPQGAGASGLSEQSMQLLDQLVPLPLASPLFSVFLVS